jgi:hypothetical protein
MALFGKRPRRVVPASTIASLAAVGRAVIAGKRAGAAGTPGLEWTDISPVSNAMRGPDRGQALQELYDAAQSDADPSMAMVGAYKLLYEADAPGRDERFLALRDAYLNIMHELRFSSGHLTRHEADRWIEVHGDLRSSFDRIVEVQVPPSGQTPAAADLAPGANKLLALTGPLPAGNEFFGERRADGKYAVFSVRCRSGDDPTRERYDETYLGEFASMPDLLRAVGAMFGTRPYWADPDLEPYFPSRRG